MKNLIIIFTICFTLINPNKAQALDPKAKAFMVMSTYGTVGGALLGFASMAFGGEPKAIAQGASLGLYAGIIFGAYVISSYNSRGASSYNPPAPEPPPYYDPTYEQNGYPQDNGGFGAPVPQEQSESSGGFFGNRVQEINDEYANFRGERKKSSLPPIYLNFFNARF